MALWWDRGAPPPEDVTALECVLALAASRELHVEEAGCGRDECRIRSVMKDEWVVMVADAVWGDFDEEELVVLVAVVAVEAVWLE